MQECSGGFCSCLLQVHKEHTSVKLYISKPRARIAKSAQRPPTGWTVRGTNLGGGEIFRAGSDRLWGPSNPLYNGYRICFQGVKRPERGVDHSLPSSTEVIEKVEIYLNSRSGPSWLVLGRNLLF
jgi:hypothetical protein